MSVNEEFLNVALHELIYKTSAKKEKRSVSIGDAIEARKTAEAILQHFQQEQETTLKQGFYAGQANTGIKLEQAHSNWDKWRGGK